MGKTIAVITARGGSKRLSQKNIKILGDHPLFVHSILYAQQNLDLIDAIYVSTDDEKIKKIAEKYDVIIIDRPQEISGDYSPTVVALQHVLQIVKEEIETVVLLQPTSPFRSKDLLKEAFNKFSLGNYDNLMTVSQSRHKLGRIRDNKFVPYNYKTGQRSQDLEPSYYENGLLYISKAKAIVENRFLNENTFPLIVESSFGTVDIDTEYDFKFAEFLLNQNLPFDK